MGNVNLRRVLLAAVMFTGLASSALADFEAGALAYRKGDFVQAIKELKGAAENGEDDAQYVLGSAYANAKPPLQDPVESVKWLKMAAERGHIEAMHSLGNVYLFLHQPGDPASAVQWFRSAADRGHADAQYLTGLLHYEGKVVSKDLVRSYMWFVLASKRGHLLAGVTMRKLRHEFSDAQVAEAMRLAKEWKPLN